MILVPLIFTLSAYVTAIAAARRWRGLRWLPPALIAATLVALYLRVVGLSMTEYRRAVEPLTLLLAPSIVALALPIHEQTPLLKRHSGLFLKMGAFTILFGCLVGLAWGLFVLHDRTLAILLSARMSTAAVAAATTNALLSAPTDSESGAVAGSLAILTGILGPLLGPMLLNRLRVHDPAARGAAYGVIAGGLGTAKALEEGPEAGAASAVGMSVSALLTAVLLPILYHLLTRLMGRL